MIFYNSKYIVPIRIEYAALTCFKKKWPAATFKLTAGFLLNYKFYEDILCFYHPGFCTKLSFKLISSVGIASR